MPLIDTHVHLYDTDRLHYDWLAGTGELERSHLLEDYCAASNGSGVTGIVFVEVDCRSSEKFAEVEWAAAQAEASGALPILGIVAFAPVESSTLAGYLDRLTDVPLVRGVRRLIQSESADLLRSGLFRRGLAAIGARGLTFDLCCTSRQLPVVIDLVAASPDVAFVLDHLGKPDITAGEWEPWATHMTTLATFENVVAVKLSGLFSEGPATEAPRYLSYAVDTFGPSRLMFGSDWPVCAQPGTHAAWVAAVDKVIAPLSTGEQDAVRFGTGSRVYRLGSPA